MNKKSLLGMKWVSFVSSDSFDNLYHLYLLHVDAINLCKKYGAVFDLGTSDVVIYVQNCSKKLERLLKKLYGDATFQRRGSEITIF